MSSSHTRSTLRITGLQSGIASGLNILVFDFLLLYGFAASCAEVLRWFHLRNLYAKRKSMRLEESNVLGVSLNTVVRTKLSIALSYLLTLYFAAAVMSGFGISGITADVYTDHGTRQVLIPGKGMPRNPISTYGKAGAETELGKMLQNSIKCSKVNGDGSAKPLTRLPNKNNTIHVCIDQKQYVLDDDMSIQRESEYGGVLAACSFGSLKDVYRLPSELGGSYDGSRIAILYSGGDCGADLNLTCTVGYRYGCAGVARVYSQNFLLVGNPINGSGLAKKTLMIDEMAVTKLERVTNVADFVLAVSQFYGLMYSNSARELSFLANMRPLKKRVRQRTSSIMVTELDIIWFVGVAICLSLTGTLASVAVACRLAVISRGREHYNSMVTVMDLLKAVEELLYKTDNGGANKSVRERIYFGIEPHRPHIGIKSDGQVGPWSEKEIE